MGELTEARIGTVRRLLEQAPDHAVESLRGLLAGERLSDTAIVTISDLIAAETEERRLRCAVFSPLAALFAPPSDLPRLSFPAATPSQLWRAVKGAAPELVFEAMEVAKAAPKEARAADAKAAEARAGDPKAADPKLTLLYDEICREAAAGLRARGDADFFALAARLDAQPDGAERLATLLTVAPVLRGAVARLPSWIHYASDDNSAALRVAFKAAADISEEAGFLFMETLFAGLKEPSEVLRLVSAVMDRPTDRYAASSELGSFGERLLDSIDRCVDTVRRFDPRRGLEGGVATASAAGLAVLRLGEFEQHIALAKDGVWGSRISAQRRSLALSMEMRLREIEPAVAAALPAQLIRSGVKRLRGAAIVTTPPDQVAVDRAMSLLGLLEECRSSAVGGGFGALRAKVIEAVDALLEGYSFELLELLHRKGGGTDVRNIRAFLDVAAEFIGLVRDPQAAEFIRRRTAAA